MTTTRDTAATALTRFDAAWSTLDKTLQGLSDKELLEPKDPAGWAAKDHLIHVATWEQALLAKLDGRARHQALGLDASTEGSEDWDGLNAQIFGATRHRPASEVLDTLRRTHEKTRAEIAALAKGGPAGPSADAFLADVPGYAEHYEQHSGWIQDLVARA